MSDMSPLGRFILLAMLWGLRFTTAAIAVILAIIVWQKWLSGSAVVATRQDYVFLAILVGLLIGAVVFARSVARELGK